MSGSASFCFGAGKALLQALDQHERGSDPARLLDGEVTEVEERYAAMPQQSFQEIIYAVVVHASG